MDNLTLKDEYTFRNRTEVVRWLDRKGYKIKKSKLYKDAKAGLLRVEDDGSVEMDSVRRYLEHPEAGVREHFETVEAGSDLEVKEYHRRTAKAKMQKIEMENKKLAFEMEKEAGKWLPREDLELEMAGRAAVLEQGLKNLFRVRAADWIHMVSGDAARAAELRAVLERELDQLLTAYARADQFQILFEGEEVNDN